MTAPTLTKMVKIEVVVASGQVDILATARSLLPAIQKLGVPV